MKNTQNDMSAFEALVGKTLREVKVSGDYKITFTVDETESYDMYHPQDCCEDVWIEDICGDLQSLVGKPILFADESSNEIDERKKAGRNLEWTFYRIGNINGSVVIRWCGDLETYYSVKVAFVRNK